MRRQNQPVDRMARSDSPRLSRRHYLAGLAGAATGFAGCAGSGPNIDTLSLAHMPIYPDIQSHVMLEEEYFEELPVEVETEIFSDGPSIVQASATGDFDVMMFGIIPAMIVVDRGIPAKIVNANIVDPMLIMGTNDFADWANCLDRTDEEFTNDQLFEFSHYDNVS